MMPLVAARRSPVRIPGRVMLYLGCQWKELPIEKDRQGRPEIHCTPIYRAFRRWQADGCFDAIFEGSVETIYGSVRLV